MVFTGPNDTGQLIGFSGGGNDEANARVFAAAPELLEALESIELRLSAYNEADRDMPADSVLVCLEKARAAIAKAKDLPDMSGRN